MLFLPHVPTGSIAKACDQMFYFNNYEPEHRVERLVPNGRMALVIELDDQLRHVHHNETLEPQQPCVEAWISGMHSGYITISALPKSELLAIQLKPGTCYPFFKRRIDELNNQVMAANQVFGPAITELRTSLKSEPDPQNKLEKATAWFNLQYDESLLIDEEIAIAVRAIEEAPTITTIQMIAEKSSYSKKHFTELFKKYVGLTPKTLQRILRFQQVLPLIHEQKQVNWAQVGAECGNFDQAHFIRDFQHFSGYNPTDFLAEGHDRLNFFPLES